MADQATLAASGQSQPVVGNAVDLSLSGTWTGTVKLQRFMSGGWQDTGDSWTANTEQVIAAATPQKFRIDWTRVSGSLVYHLIDTIRQ